MDESRDWQVEVLRVTVFPRDISSASVQRIWESVIDQHPDEIHFQKDKIDAREIEFDNGRMVLAKHTDRVDWRYLSKPRDESDLMQLPIIGRLDEKLRVFTELAHRWLFSSDMLQVNRLAFGAVLLILVDTVQEGYSILEKLLPAMNLRNARELNYQINRRRDSAIAPGIEVNRLSKWNVYSGKLVTVALNPSQQQQHSTTSDLSIACRLELDINTSQEISNPLPTNNLASIFDELVELGLEISEKGDIE